MFAEEFALLQTPGIFPRGSTKADMTIEEFKKDNNLEFLYEKT